MPYDFLKYHPYKIDYSNFQKNLMSAFLSPTTKLKIKYLSTWVDILENADSKVCVDFDESFNSDINYFPSLQFYQFKMSLFNDSRNCASIHFNIDNLEEKLLLELSSSENVIVEISEFAESDSAIKWDSIPNHENFAFKNNRLPILIVPFLLGQYNYLVVDGNHRLSYAINNKQNLIKAIFISLSQITEPGLFMSRFDYYFYLFNYEIVDFCNKILNEKMVLDQLIESSFIKNHLL